MPRPSTNPSPADSHPLRADFFVASRIRAARRTERQARPQLPLAKRTMLQRSMADEITMQGTFTDAELLHEVRRLTSLERQATARLIAALGELDGRRLYLG